ncbi:3-oxoacyl-[acyl-carrier-protein] reductase [Clostridium argentinense CDC 2741]|uniref:3-oxoacyl-[acyl-carrier-protein] reductase n=1 Tax=Clostridium argentinense CDC 2741 TaxID=1418104 RepID=A0A0C1UEH9_9CLOT|nr:3-oxoacyl-[acyl-carrier-protein] reductase [Clostridium argentinense]ARC83366.1 beta-ketoacyl-ACP reductase [Clostridium argentinense]KIE45790.1 3-oxoacyl-[acyl-carrier-protein] reductase [Clostridium argentinense CDC 2741]NFF39192.1 3-oxoacyl-[acyl-carrier-protein] reductase [Clostridium argentinense]NFP49604.1 3-oxoacyl-[acyl-carrier-protein] reductase [Clostridium argentinense]NFP72307.1 3-oxoacyl-[acyl-carrier-protein] reductase [Clostridium argentinense]
MLQGKNVVITGASRGIGRAIALKLASLGANIVFSFKNSINKADELVKEIEALGVKAKAVQGDIAKLKDAEELIRICKENFGSVDVLVNNAGVTKDNLVMRMKEEDFDTVIDTNLKGTFNTIKHATPIMMKQRSGKIINISSVVGVVGNAGQANYSASKAGVIGLTKSVAKELGSRGINVNAIAPGFIETDMTEVLKDNIKENLLNNIPLKKLGSSEDVANLVVFLASEQSKYITGQVINVDGGMVM